MAPSVFTLAFLFTLSKSQQMVKVPAQQIGRCNHLSELIFCAGMEENIYSAAREHLQDLKIELKGLTRCLEDYEDYSDEMGEGLVPEERGRLVASSGISAYQMVHRLIQLKSLVQTKGDFKDILNHNEEQWPTLKDLKNTMQAFLNIQDTLDLPLDKLGLLLSGGQERAELRAKHGAEIGIFALQNEHFILAFEWLEWCRAKVIREEDQSLSLFLIDQYMDVIIKAHNKGLKKFPDAHLSFFDHEITREQKRRVKRKTIYKEDMKGGKGHPSTWANFWALCSGESLQTEVEKSQLFCYLEKKGAWLLSPLKMEQLAPQVLQIHEALVEREMEAIKSCGIMSRDEFNVSLLPYVDQLKDEPSFLNTKVELLTNLKAIGPNAAETCVRPEQVVGRQNGSYSRPHTDPVEQEDFLANGGELMATILFYLNDVAEGGRTAFCNYRTSAFPLKGSAVLWYHLWRNGSIKEDTYHGSCPVLYGHKIAAAKGIRYDAQWRTYGCSLNPND